MTLNELAHHQPKPGRPRRRDQIPQRPTAAEQITRIKGRETPIMNHMNDIPLVVLAAEIDATVAELAADLADDVGYDNTGFRVISAELAAGVIAAHRERLAAQAAREAEKRAAAEEARAQARAEREVERQRRALLDERQRQMLRDNPGLSAIEVMMAGAHSPAMTAATQRVEEWLGGHPDRPLVYHPINRED